MIISTVVLTLFHHANKAVEVQLTLEGAVLVAVEEALHDLIDKGFSVVNFEGSSMRHPRADVAVSVVFGLREHVVELGGEVFVSCNLSCQSCIHGIVIDS